MARPLKRLQYESVNRSGVDERLVTGRQQGLVMDITRRHFLRAAGVSLALPWLASAAPAVRPPRRMICVCTPLGLHPQFLFPERAGKDYPSTPYLEVFDDLRDDFTLISGLAHPDVGHSHDSIF